MMRVGPVVAEGVLIEYGDYNANTGPMNVIAVDAEGTVTTLLADMPTEEVQRYRVFDGAVWLPSIDPRGAAAGFIATNKGGTWHMVTVEVDGLAVVEHLYDVQPDPDTGDLLVCGAHLPDTAFVWRSTDDGATWVEELAHATGEPDGYNRFYGFRRSGGALVVSKTEEPGHFVLTEGAWVETAEVEFDDDPDPAYPTASLPGGSGKWSASEADDGSTYLCDRDAIYLLPPPD